MKTLRLIVIGMILFIASVSQAQISVNLNIGSPPQWGPAGYTEVRYYYLPDVEAYYDVHSSLFIYYHQGLWVRRTHLPSRYKSYDLYSGYKVIMTGHYDNAPYTHFKEHKKMYAKGYHGEPQKNIGEKPGNGNSDTKSNSKGNSNKNSKQGNGNGNGKS